MGVLQVTEWAKALNVCSKVLDIGCGNGIPVTQAVHGQGHTIFAIDSSMSMIHAFKQQFPNVTAKCEAVEHSDFFGETYDGVIAIGIMFLLEESEQLAMIERVSDILLPGGQFLFSAPIESGKWNDFMTEQESLSLGIDAYEQALSLSGMQLLNCFSDEGDNNYYSAMRKIS